MAGIKLKLIRPKRRPRKQKFTKELHRRASRVWDQAISAFIIAVAFEVSRHQDTGMSLASLFATARKVRSLTKLPPLNPKIGSRKGFTDIDGNYDGGGFRSSAVGERLGIASSNILYGSAYRPVFQFSFQITVYQYLLHEFGYQTAAWNSLEKGITAMNDYLQNYSFQAVPQLAQWFQLQAG